MLEGGWQMRGRVGIRTADDATSFSVRWRQQDQDFDIHLNGALGVSVAHIYGDDRSIVIDVPKQGRFEASNATQLLKDHTGLELPIESLRYWVRGIPEPGIAYERGDSTLEQSGWHIEYLAFEGDDPVKMRLERPEVRIILVVNSWAT